MDKNKELKSYLESFLKDDFEKYLNSPTEPTALRINKLKTDKQQFLKFLDRHQVKYNNIDFNPDGFILEDDALPLSHTLIFFTGWFQYQGISSQLPVLLLDPKPGDYVLDIAAAPGSKAAQIASFMKNDGVLIMNDNSYQRLQALNANIQRSGAFNTVTFNYRGERFGKMLPEYFDKILVDAPCTALGTLASNQEVGGWWSQAKLEKLSGIQHYLLVSALKSLKVGGTIVYSTCSITPEENEVLINTMLQQYPVKIVDLQTEISAKFDNGMTKFKSENLHKDLEKALRIWPHKHRMEGFFAVKLQKLDHIKEDSQNDGQNITLLKSFEDPDIKPVLNNLSELWGIPDDVWQDYRYYTTKERIWVVAGPLQEIPVDKFISAGVLLAEKRLSGWKLVNASVQLLSSHIKNRRISLSEPDLKKLFLNSELDGTELEYGYYALEYAQDLIASVYVEKGKMKIRVPHKFNLVL